MDMSFFYTHATPTEFIRKISSFHLFAQVEIIFNHEGHEDTRSFFIHLFLFVFLRAMVIVSAALKKFYRSGRRETQSFLLFSVVSLRTSALSAVKYGRNDDHSRCFEHGAF